ncbi:MAG: hypothetical protein ACI4N4_04910 [Candidatus Fimenecus sp.]
MAKKVITPEEYQARIDKKVNRRKIFFGTFTKSLAFFLAIAMVYTLATIAFTPTVATATGQNTIENATSKGNDDEVDFGGESIGESTGSESTGTESTGGESTGTESTGGNTAAADTSKADAVKLLNDVTAKAAKGNYNWKRVCNYTKDGAIDVGSATDTLNSIIQKVVTSNDNPYDDNSDLSSVVGGFIGIGDKDAKVTGGKAPDGMSEDYLLKAMSLTEGDIKQYKQSGNVYMFQLNQCSNPQKDNSNALHHATNDFITHSEVDAAIKNALGSLGSLIKLESSDVTYSSIVIKATIADSKLTNLELSYVFSAQLSLKATLVPINGKGKAKTVATYSDFVY